MAETALDVLPLAAIKRELRQVIEADATEYDDLLTEQIGAAVSFVEQYTRAPLIDTTDTFRCHRPETDCPLELRTDHVTAVDPIRYWTPGTALRLDPDGTIAVADLGRRVQLNGLYQIWPPEDGWPEVEERSLLEVDLTRAAEITGGIRQAVVLCVRQLFDGGSEIERTAAMNVLLKPWRNGATP